MRHTVFFISFMAIMFFPLNAMDGKREEPTQIIFHKEPDDNGLTVKTTITISPEEWTSYEKQLVKNSTGEVLAELGYNVPKNRNQYVEISLTKVTPCAKKLLETVCEHLASEGIPSVGMCIMPSNTTEVQLCHDLGFELKKNFKQQSFIHTYEKKLLMQQSQNSTETTHHT